MASYRVEMQGECREIYDVEADSEEEAMANWSSGILWLSEATSMEPVSALKEED